MSFKSFKSFILENKPLEILDESWDKIERDFQKIVDKYQKYTTTADSIPAAPDSSKFSATRSGFIELRKDHITRGGYYGLDVWYPYAIVVGGNVDLKIRKKIATEVEKVVNKYKGKTFIRDGSDAYDIAYREKGGTNFSTYGVVKGERQK